VARRAQPGGHVRDRTATNGYNTLGQLVSTTDALNKTRTFPYDLYGNKVSETDPTGALMEYTYDAPGQLTKTTLKGYTGDPNNPSAPTDPIVESRAYDPAGRLASVTDAMGWQMLYTYPDNGLTATVTRKNPITSATFLAESNVYDAAGRAVTRDEPGGVTVTNAYNNMGQLTGQTGVGAGAATAARVYGYDLGGQMTSFEEGGAASTVSYNDRGLNTGGTGASGSSAFTWTADGLMASRQDAGGTSTYGYDTAGRLSTVSDAASADRLSLSYNNLNQATSITYGASGNRRSFGYDGLRRLTSDALSTSGSAGIASIVYGYDTDGNLTSKTTTGFAGSAANTYTYDNVNRLVSWNDGATTATYEYDKSGNRTRIGSRTFTYDSRNRLVSDSNTTYSYSARGSLTGTTEGTVTTPSTFDAYGQQISQGPQTYAYDGLGRVLSVASGEVFTYSGTSNELASDGTAVYSRGPGGNVLGTKQATSTGRFVWTDLHTDVVAELTSTDATLSGSRAYNPLGVVLAATAMTGNLGYQSGWTDPVTSRVNMHARWYNPATAQFASPGRRGRFRHAVVGAGQPLRLRRRQPVDGDGPHRALRLLQLGEEQGFGRGEQGGQCRPCTRRARSTPKPVCRRSKTPIRPPPTGSRSTKPRSPGSWSAPSSASAAGH